MKWCGNIETHKVPQNQYLEISNFFYDHKQHVDCVILTLNESSHTPLLYETCCSVNCIKTNNSCNNINDGKYFLELPDNNQKRLISHYGNVYENENTLNQAYAMYHRGHTTTDDDEIMTNLKNCFENFFDQSKQTVHQRFHLDYPAQYGITVKQQIKAIFPFFLALNYRVDWKCEKASCAHDFTFVLPNFKILYCDGSEFLIHPSYNPFNIVAYIGCNKPFHILGADSRGLFSYSKTKWKDHDPYNIFQKQDVPASEQMTAWNVMNTIAKDIISSDRWKRSTLLFKSVYDCDDVGSVIKIAFTKLKTHNANELIDKFIINKNEYIEYICTLIEIVATYITTNRVGNNCLKFKSFLLAAEHVYRHYNEIRDKLVSDQTLISENVMNYPKQFPDGLYLYTDDETDIRKCASLYLYHVPNQYNKTKWSTIKIEYCWRNRIQYLSTICAIKVP